MVTIVKHNLEERKEMYYKCSKEEILSMLSERYKYHTKEELVEIISIDDIALSSDSVMDKELKHMFKPVPYSQLRTPYYNKSK